MSQLRGRGLFRPNGGGSVKGRGKSVAGPGRDLVVKDHLARGQRGNMLPRAVGLARSRDLQEMERPWRGGRKEEQEEDLREVQVRVEAADRPPGEVADLLPAGDPPLRPRPGPP